MEWIPKASGAPLRGGDLVQTDTHSWIKFEDGALLDVSKGSLVTIETPTASRIEAGRLLFEAKKKNRAEPPSLSAPKFTWRDSALDPDPPKVAISLSREGDGRISQHGGSGRVQTHRGDQVDLARDTGLDVDSDGAAGPAVALPPAPTGLRPPVGAALSYPNPAEATTLLAWDAVAASSFRVIVAADGWLESPLLDETVGTNALSLNGLAEGKYYWRVAARSAAGREGAFSELARFSIAVAIKPPRLVIRSFEVRKNVLRIIGQTDPGASVSVHGQPVDVRSDGSFEEFIALGVPLPQTVQIRARTKQGGEALRSLTATELRGPSDE